MNQEKNQDWKAEFHTWHNRFWHQKKFAPAAMDVIGWITQNRIHIAADVATGYEEQLQQKDREIKRLNERIEQLQQRKTLTQRLKELWK